MMVATGYDINWEIEQVEAALDYFYDFATIVENEDGTVDFGPQNVASKIEELEGLHEELIEEQYHLWWGDA